MTDEELKQLVASLAIDQKEMAKESDKRNKETDKLFKETNKATQRTWQTNRWFRQKVWQFYRRLGATFHDQDTSRAF